MEIYTDKGFRALALKAAEILTVTGWTSPGNSQVLSLWTAHCLLFDYHPDSYRYDSKLHELYSLIYQHIPEISFDDFDTYMCQFLV